MNTGTGNICRGGSKDHSQVRYYMHRLFGLGLSYSVTPRLTQRSSLLEVKVCVVWVEFNVSILGCVSDVHYSPVKSMVVHFSRSQQSLQSIDVLNNLQQNNSSISII